MLYENANKVPNRGYCRSLCLVANMLYVLGGYNGSEPCSRRSFVGSKSSSFYH
jgi:hypothetical protein